MSWWWRTKPRSIVKTVQWFSDFSKLEGKNWDEEKFISSDKKIHPVRREYIYNAHSDEDDYIGKLSFNDFLSGKKDKVGKDAESNGRNDKITFEFFGFGYVDTDGSIVTTDVGKRICAGTFDGEDYLKQLLKLQFPNPISGLKNSKKDDYIYPLQLICMAINDFGFLNRSELVLLFGCNNISDYPKVKKGITDFREAYNKLPNKNIREDVKTLCKKTYESMYGILSNKIDTYYEYSEALCRCLNYTGLFKTSGRSIATKVRVPSYSKIKFDLILNEYTFEKKEYLSVKDYMDYFGSPNSINLPWNNARARKQILNEKVEYLKNNISDFSKEFIDSNAIEEQIKKAEIVIEESGNDYSKLKDAENDIIAFITNAKEKEFIETTSQKKETRQEILDMYDEILGQIDMGALWLEVNTWKSLVALNGKKNVKRNFNIEEDLTPKSFAPGIGNTPDMEMYLDDYIIIPEVSLMTGVRQWEHEASSVVDHVLSFINENPTKKVLGLFISSSINIRTQWQFFILNKESWVGKPVPIVPLTIVQYKSLISKFYDKNKDANSFAVLIDKLHNIAVHSKDFNDWFAKTETYLKGPSIFA